VVAGVAGVAGLVTSLRPVAAGLAVERSGVPEPEAPGWAAVAVGVVVVEWEAAVAAFLAYT
jgi:hypothetical protein